MAGKLIPLSEAAEFLGVSAERLNELRQGNEIYGYRDGASWKFKQEDVERLKESLAGGGSSSGSGADLDFALPAADEKDDLLLAPDLSGPSLRGGSSIQVGSEERLKKTGSEINLASGSSVAKEAGSDVSLASDVIRGIVGGSDVPLAQPKGRSTEKMAGPAKPAHGDDEEFVLGSPLDMDMDLTGSKTMLKSGSGPLGSGLLGSGPIQVGGDNVLDAAAGGSSLSGSSSVGIGDDHENVLGGSSGSDITHRPGDSGILLIDPADSGLSLEAPPELTGSGTKVGDATVDFQAGAEDDFLLKPLEEGGDEDSESGSQVIMLDTEGAFDEKSSTLIADSLPNMPGGMDFGGGMGMGVATAPAPPVIPPGMVVVPKETPFSLMSVVGLVACTLVLAVGGAMMYDLVRNIWSWDSPYGFNSALMDSILGK